MTITIDFEISLIQVKELLLLTFHIVGVDNIAKVCMNRMNSFVRLRNSKLSQLQHRQFAYTKPLRRCVVVTFSMQWINV
jgi:hypothetical protein